jgi:hypothetical protein
MALEFKDKEESDSAGSETQTKEHHGVNQDDEKSGRSQRARIEHHNRIEQCIESH